MRRLPRDPCLSLAVPVVQEFAEQAGLEARTWDHWGQYIEMTWEEASVSKQIKIVPVDLESVIAVDATASKLVGRRRRPRRDSKWCWRGFGEVDLRADHGPERLGAVLAEAASYLKALGPQEPENEYQKMLAHVTGRILPILVAFAAAHNGRMKTDNHALPWWFVIEWPEADPLYQLFVQADRRYGISVSSWVRSHKRTGILFRRQWTHAQEEIAPGVYMSAEPGLHAGDWTDVEALQRLLTQAEERAERFLREQDAGR